MIADFLGTHPRTKKALAEAMRTSTREVELAVQQERLEGVPICSDDEGYWLARHPQEVRDCAERLRRRYINQALTVRALRRTAQRLEERRDLRLWS